MEKIQSIDFLSLNLAYKLSRKITVSIDNTQLLLIVKEVAKRIASLITPIFIVGDLCAMTFSSLVCLGIGAVRLFGGQSPAYLEEAGSLEVSLYNLVKIPLMLISSTVGMLVSLFHPESGQVCMRKPLRWMAYPSFKAKMLALRSRLNKMEAGDHYLLPAVEVFPDSEKELRELSYLPSYGSHIRYLLVEKLLGGLFKIELIERGALHRVSDPLSEEEAGALLEKVLALRFQFGHGQSHREVFNYFHQNDMLNDLGTQIGINNCIITNFFAALEVVRHRGGRGGFNELCNDIKLKAVNRYYMYANDFYPFGNMQNVVQEIEVNLTAGNI